MSLALDGVLSATQTQLLHAHIATCPSCAAMWASMTALSRTFRAAPQVEPQTGFVARFEARLAHREERRRRVLVGVLLGIGTIALTLLALPSILGALSLTGQLVLPYRVIAQAQGLLDWLYLVASGLKETAWVLVRYTCTGPWGPACLILLAVAAAATALWTKTLVGRLSAQRVRA
jgi:predicted anti-sigma-YlaC factor YlaD